MLIQTFKVFFVGAIVLSLFLIDYTLGSNNFSIFRRILCKAMCVMKRLVRKDSLLADPALNDALISFPTYLTEVLLFVFAVWIINKFKHHRDDRLDNLLKESKDSLRQTNEFLEKWRLRKINRLMTRESDYLNDEPQRIKPFKIEVPILHMAIVDTHSTSRSQPERGDAGDAINLTDFTLLSMTSLLDDEVFDTLDCNLLDECHVEKFSRRNRSLEFQINPLYEVKEESTS